MQLGTSMSGESSIPDSATLKFAAAPSNEMSMLLLSNYMVSPPIRKKPLQPLE